VRGSNPRPSDHCNLNLNWFNSAAIPIATEVKIRNSMVTSPAKEMDSSPARSVRYLPPHRALKLHQASFLGDTEARRGFGSNCFSRHQIPQNAREGASLPAPIPARLRRWIISLQDRSAPFSPNRKSFLIKLGRFSALSEASNLEMDKIASKGASNRQQTTVEIYGPVTTNLGNLLPALSKVGRNLIAQQPLFEHHMQDWRREWDSNPRILADLRFSRPVQ
jgi:hypothetical protein